MAVAHFVIGLDVGTTYVKSVVYDQDGKIRAEAREKITLLYPRPGWVEIEPEKLWSSIQSVIRDAVSRANLSFADITSIGICTQRSTFITWHKNTGKPFHNFINWKDIRSKDVAKRLNRSFQCKALRMGSKMMHLVTRHARYSAGRAFKFNATPMSTKLHWVIKNNNMLKKAIKDEVALFGTLDCWILHKFSRGKLHIVEIGNIGTTCLFNPYTCQYSSRIFRLLNFKYGMMPEIVSSAGNHFGSTDPSIFDGHSIPIRAVMADQSASIFGSDCLKCGQAKLTIGTGTFLDVNTGSKARAFKKTIVPIVAWKTDRGVAYASEGFIHDAGSLIEWSSQLGLFTDVDETSRIAESLGTNHGVYFIPGFGGLQSPIMDPYASAGFIGCSPTTGSKEMLRAILESIAFGIKYIYDIMNTRTEPISERIEVDGGVSANDFVVQTISNLTNRTIVRRSNSENVASFGVAFLSGLSSGVWNSQEDILNIRTVEREFYPMKDTRLHEDYAQWIRACSRFTKWIEHSA